MEKNAKIKIKNGKEWKKCSVLLWRTGKNAKNASFFSKERIRTQERCVLLKRTSAQPWYLPEASTYSTTYSAFSWSYLNGSTFPTDMYEYLPVGIHVLHHILCLLLLLLAPGLVHQYLLVLLVTSLKEV